MARDGAALRGVDCAFGGNVPIGSGLSSSAALECGFAILVEEAAVSRFEEGMARAFRDRLGKPAVLHVCRLTGGTERVV
jgi:galactokinase